MDALAEGRGEVMGLVFFMKIRRSLDAGSILVINFHVNRLKEKGWVSLFKVEEGLDSFQLIRSWVSPC